jgi:hypothetical protein
MERGKMLIVNRKNKIILITAGTIDLIMEEIRNRNAY